MKNIIHKTLILLALGLFFTDAQAQVTRKQRNRADRREDVRDRREDVRDRREDVRDAQHQGGPLDRVEDRRDRREDVRDRREDKRDRRRKGTFQTQCHPRPAVVVMQTPRTGRLIISNQPRGYYHPRYYRHRRHRMHCGAPNRHCR